MSNDVLPTRFRVWLVAVLLSCATGQGVAEETTRDLAIADRVVRALDLIGTPYRPSGSSPRTGFDCSGFIAHVFRVAEAVDLPRTAREMFALAATKARKVARDALEPGDLVFFRIGRLGRRVDHVGLYVGDDRFVHAPASGGAVRIDTLDLPYWRRHYAGARRLDPAALTPPVSENAIDDGSTAVIAPEGSEASGGPLTALAGTDELLARQSGDSQ